MPLIITSQPSSYQSANDDVIYCISEPAKTLDPTTYPNYKFICDVYINDVLISRQKRVPNPKTKIGVFEIGRIIQSYCLQNFKPTSNIVCQVIGANECYVNVMVKFGEEYGFDAYYSQITATDVKLFNSYNYRNDSKLALASFTNTFITDRPSLSVVPYTAAFDFLTFFSSTTTPVIVTFESNTIAPIALTTFTPVEADIYTVLNISPAKVNAIIPFAITANTQWYSITIGSKRYFIIPSCEPLFEPTTFVFLNKYGGFDTMHFTKKKNKVVSNEKKSYGTLPYGISDIGQVYYELGGVINGNSPTYNVNRKEALTVFSDWLKTDDFLFVDQLLTSPLVYIRESGKFFPITISNQNIEYKKLEVDDFFQLELQFNYSDLINTQRR